MLEKSFPLFYCTNRDQFILQEGGYGRVVGRLKEIIIRDNTNIFPIEVEEFLTTHPDVMEVQVKQLCDVSYFTEHLVLGHYIK
jgi:fatty-acyl-CoA synthase